MEFFTILAVVAVIIAVGLHLNKKKKASPTEAVADPIPVKPEVAPYKVETPVAPEPVGKAADDIVEAPAPAAKPAKAPRAKKAATPKETKPKAAARTAKPKKPKMTVAK